MLTTLDALTTEGVGGPPTAALRGVFHLFMQTGFDGSPETVQLFDEVLTTLVGLVDDATVRALDVGSGPVPMLLPRFVGAVHGRREPSASAGAPAAPAAPPERRRALRDPAEDASNPLTIARRASPGQLLEMAIAPEISEQL
ncbi:MAG: hypothetical protein ACRCTI_00860, partial [Beijerinckiaceae bacterium]